MPHFSRNEVILVRYPFSDLSAAKIRPGVVVGALDRSPDYLIVPLTSRLKPLAQGEFVLTDSSGAGLNLMSAVKRGVYTVHERLILKSVGHLSAADSKQIEQSLRLWLELA